MRCVAQGCSKARRLNPTSKFCVDCDKKNKSKIGRNLNSERQNQARASVHESNRDMNASLSPDPTLADNVFGAQQFPPHPPAPIVSASLNGAGAQGRANAIQPPQGRANAIQSPQNSFSQLPPHDFQPQYVNQPPPVDIQSLQHSYNQLLVNGPQPHTQAQMFGMMLHLVSKQTENDLVKNEVLRNTQRIQELENKIGDETVVSEKLGLVIRNLPMPQEGHTELDNVRDALTEVRAPGVDVYRDVIKAVRFGNREDYLGIVKVEMSTDEARTSVMITKKNLKFHQNELIRNIIIGNLKSEAQMAFGNFTNDLLQMIPGGDQVYVTRNGHLRQRDSAATNRYNQGQNQPPNYRQNGPISTHTNSYQHRPRVPMPNNARRTVHFQQPTRQQHYAPSSQFQPRHQQFTSVTNSQHQPRQQQPPLGNNFYGQGRSHNHESSSAPVVNNPQNEAQEELFDPFSNIEAPTMQSLQMQLPSDPNYSGQQASSFQGQ